MDIGGHWVAECTVSSGLLRTYQPFDPFWDPSLFRVCGLGGAFCENWVTVFLLGRLPVVVCGCVGVFPTYHHELGCLMRITLQFLLGVLCFSTVPLPNTNPNGKELVFCLVTVALPVLHSSLLKVWSLSVPNVLRRLARRMLLSLILSMLTLRPGPPLLVL